MVGTECISELAWLLLLVIGLRLSFSLGVAYIDSVCIVEGRAILHLFFSWLELQVDVRCAFSVLTKDLIRRWTLLEISTSAGQAVM